MSFVCAAMSRTENWREPPLTSFACAGSHVGRCAVDIVRGTSRRSVNGFAAVDAEVC